MKIGVCIKQVPDTESVIQLNGDKTKILTDGLKMILNPYDEYAVEEGIKTKEALGGESVVLTVGPTKAAEALRTAMAMGIDRAIHIVEENADQLDVATMALLASKKLGEEKCDVIFTGVKAIDDDCSQFTQILAELLGMAHVTQVAKIDIKNDKALLIRDVEGGTTEEWEVFLPFVCSLAKGINEPRYASLPGIMKAKKKPLDGVTPALLGFGPDYLKTTRLIQPIDFALPPERKAGMKIDGSDPVVGAAKIIDYLQNEVRII